MKNPRILSQAAGFFSLRRAVDVEAERQQGVEHCAETSRYEQPQRLRAPSPDCGVEFVVQRFAWRPEVTTEP